MRKDERQQKLGFDPSEGQTSVPQGIVPKRNKSAQNQTREIAVPSNGIYQGVRGTISDKESFERVPDSIWPTARLKTSRADGYIQLRPEVDELLVSPEEARLAAVTEFMFEQTKTFSDINADVLDILSCTWLRRSTPSNDGVVMDFDEILERRGIQPKKSGRYRGGFESEQRLEHMRALSTIQSLLLMLKIQTWSGEGKKRRRNLEDYEGRVFVITDKMGQYRLLDGANYYKMDLKRFIFQPGKLFALFLRSSRETALLSEKALEYHPNKELWEKRLCRYYSYLWRCRATSADYSHPVRVSTLFREGLRMEINPHRQSWQVQRLEKCCDRLKEDEVYADWQWAQCDEKVPFSDWTIAVEPPARIQSHYQHILRPDKPQRRYLKALGISGEEIRDKRVSLGLSQTRLAEQLGISQARLSQIESGRSRRSAMPKSVIVWFTGNGDPQKTGTD